MTGPACCLAPGRRLRPQTSTSACSGRSYIVSHHPSLQLAHFSSECPLLLRCLLGWVPDAPARNVPRVVLALDLRFGPPASPTAPPFVATPVLARTVTSPQATDAPRPNAPQPETCHDIIPTRNCYVAASTVNSPASAQLPPKKTPSAIALGSGVRQSCTRLRTCPRLHYGTDPSPVPVASIWLRPRSSSVPANFPMHLGRAAPHLTKVWMRSRIPDQLDPSSSGLAQTKRGRGSKGLLLASIHMVPAGVRQPWPELLLFPGSTLDKPALLLPVTHDCLPPSVVPFPSRSCRCVSAALRVTPTPGFEWPSHWRIRLHVHMCMSRQAGTRVNSLGWRACRPCLLARLVSPWCVMV